MKKLFILLLTTITLATIPTYAFAISPTTSVTTPTPSSKITITPSTKDTPTDSVEQDRIQKIKQMVADKVSKLKLVEKLGLLGTVKEVTSTQITIEDDAKNPYIIDIDELTKFTDSSTSTKSFGISDIKPNDYLSFVGLYNKETKRLLARTVTRVKSIPIYFEGAVTEKDTKNFMLTVVDGKGNKKIIDFQNSTKTQSYTKTDGAVKSGFSKIQTDERIFIAGFADKDDNTKIIPSRVIFFPELPPSANMDKFQKILSGNSDTPISSGSGRKLVPITK